MDSRTTLALGPDAERISTWRGPASIEHRNDLWPNGEPVARDEWVRANVDDILAEIEQGLRHDARDVRRLPRRMHW
jgi:hypothetical protein